MDFTDFVYTLAALGGLGLVSIVLGRAFLRWLGSEAEQQRTDLAQQASRCGLYPRR